jgi:hypothetical protein
LDEVEADAQQDDGGDDDEARHVASRGRHHAGDEQDNDQRIAKARQELQHERPVLLGRRIIGSMPRQA